MGGGLLLWWHTHLPPAGQINMVSGAQGFGSGYTWVWILALLLTSCGPQTSIFWSVNVYHSPYLMKAGVNTKWNKQCDHMVSVQKMAAVFIKRGLLWATIPFNLLALDLTLHITWFYFQCSILETLKSFLFICHRIGMMIIGIFSVLLASMFPVPKTVPGNKCSCCCCSVAKLCLTLSYPVDCSMQTHLSSTISWMFTESVMLFNHLILYHSPFSFCLHQGLFQWVVSLHQVAKVLELQLRHQSFQWRFWVFSKDLFEWMKTLMLPAFGKSD